MKRLLEFIGFRPSKNDWLVFAWFALILGVVGAVLGLLLGESRRAFTHLGVMCWLFILSLYVHRLQLARQARHDDKTSHENTHVA
jgi:predicted Abi (CAAX) family protease